MADEFTKTFSSVQEEIEYWKSLCMKYKERLIHNICNLLLPVAGFFTVVLMQIDSHHILFSVWLFSVAAALLHKTL